MDPFLIIQIGYLNCAPTTGFIHKSNLSRENDLDSPGGTSLGSDSENALVHMDGVFTGNHLVDRALSLLLGLLSSRRHLCYKSVSLQKNLINLSNETMEGSRGKLKNDITTP